MTFFVTPVELSLELSRWSSDPMNGCIYAADCIGKMWPLTKERSPFIQIMLSYKMPILNKYYWHYVINFLRNGTLADTKKIRQEMVAIVTSQPNNSKKHTISHIQKALALSLACGLMW